MKSVPAIVFLVAGFFTVLTAGNPFRVRRHDIEIKNTNGETFHGKTGTPLVFNPDKRDNMRQGISDIHTNEDEDTTGDSSLREMTEDDDDDMNSRVVEDFKSGVSGKDDDQDDDDESDDDESDDEKDKKNPEELGEGYEKIGDMGSKNKDDEDDEEDRDSKGSKDKDSDEGDIMDKSSKSSEDDKGPPDLNGEFPPSADQVSKLPKDEELTPEEADKTLADKRKDYVQFTLRQRFEPGLKYKESAAYKILAGNVMHDVNRVFKSTGVVRDVLFREAKNVGGPPYRSKVQVYLKLQNVNSDKLKKAVDHGLINGMITVTGSFLAK